MVEEKYLKKSGSLEQKLNQIKLQDFTIENFNFEEDYLKKQKPQDDLEHMPEVQSYDTENLEAMGNVSESKVLEDSEDKTLKKLLDINPKILP